MKVNLINAGAIAITVIGVFLLLPGLVAAQNSNGLYGAAAPDDAGFVRIVHGGGADPLRDIWIGATRFSEVAPESASPYRPVDPGIHQILIGDQSQEIIPRRGSYYSVVVDRRRLVVLEDPEHTRPDRAQIFLYNFWDEGPLSLRTADGATTLIEPVAHEASGVIEVNPVPVELALFHGGERIAQVGDPELRRGQSYSVFVFGAAEDQRVFVEQAALVLE